ncbi:hypothetical protein D3C83_01050 [compost metagenome]
MQRIELTREGLDRRGLLDGIVPVDVERALDARLDEQGNARLPAHLLFFPPEQAGHTADDISRRMGQQVERVLDPASALERTRIDRHPQRLRQLARVKRLGARRQRDGAFQHAAIHVGGDQPFSKLLQRALRKRRFLGPQAPQDHLDPQIQDGQLDHLGVGDAQIALHEHRHGHHRGRARLFSRARPAVHRRQLILKPGVEQLVPMQPQKPEEFPYPTETLQDELLLPRRRDRRCPTRDCHLHASSGRGPASASDHKSSGPSILGVQTTRFSRQLNRSAF